MTMTGTLEDERERSVRGLLALGSTDGVAWLLQQLVYSR